MWLDWRQYINLPVLNKVGNFIVVNPTTLDQFCEFRSSHTTKGIANLPLTHLLEYYITRVMEITLKVSSKFGHSYIAMDMDDVDHLVEWVDEMREKVSTMGKRAFTS